VYFVQRKDCVGVFVHFRALQYSFHDNCVLMYRVMLNTFFGSDFAIIESEHNTTFINTIPKWQSYFKGVQWAETSYPVVEGGGWPRRTESLGWENPRRQVQSGAIRKCLTPFCNLGNTRRIWIRERFQATSFNKFGNSQRPNLRSN
jgi:hypothetical protein